MATLRAYFEREAATYLERLRAMLENVEEAFTAGDLHRVMRALRGTAQMAREDHVYNVALTVERAVRHGAPRVAPPADLAARLAATLDELDVLVDAGRDLTADSALAARAAARWSDAGGAAAGQEPITAPDSGPTRAFLAFAAREVGAIADELERGVTALITNPLDRETIKRVLRQQRALLGAARLDDVPIVAETLRAVEDLTRVIAKLDVPVKGEWLDVFRSARDIMHVAAPALAAREQPTQTNALSRLRTLREELLDRYGAGEAISMAPGEDLQATTAVVSAPVPPEDTAPEDTVQHEAVQEEAVQEEAVQEEAVQEEAVQEEAVQHEAAQEEAVQHEAHEATHRRESFEERAAHDVTSHAATATDESRHGPVTHEATGPDHTGYAEAAQEVDAGTGTTAHPPSHEAVTPYGAQQEASARSEAQPDETRIDASAHDEVTHDAPRDDSPDDDPPSDDSAGDDPTDVEAPAASGAVEGAASAAAAAELAEPTPVSWPSAEEPAALAPGSGYRPPTPAEETTAWSEAAAAIDAARESAVPRAVAAALDPDAVVDIRSLCYSGARALHRALALRAKLEVAIERNSDTQELVDEIFDLIRLGLE